jgi:putative spermidine/putrescine transport system substrate-binding protein
LVEPSKAAVSRAVSAIIVIIIVIVASAVGYYAFVSTTPSTPSSSFTASTNANNVLNVVSWAGSTSDGLEAQVPGFNKQYGTVTNVILQGGAGETLAKLRASVGHQSIDVWYTNSEAALNAVRSGLLEPIDTTKVTNLNNYVSAPLFTGFTGTPFVVNGTVYGIQEEVGYVGIIVRTDLVNASQITSYKDLWNPIYAKKVAMPQLYWYTGGDVFWVSQWWTGSPNNTSVAFQKLQALVPNIADLYSTDSEVVRLLVSGQAPIVVAPFYNAYAAAQDKAPVKVIVPSDSPLFAYTDMITFVKGSPASDELKYDFLNYMMQTDVQNAYSAITGDYALLNNPTVPQALQTFVGFSNLWGIDPAYAVANYPAWSDAWQKQIVPLLSS